MSRVAPTRKGAQPAVSADNPEKLVWHVAGLKPNCHAIVLANLGRQGIAAFLPLEETTVRARGAFVQRIAPLFPGYVFVGLDPARGSWRSVNATRGITRLLAFGGRPAEVPCGLIAGLMRRCDGRGRLVARGDACPPPAPGARVSLARGPFAGFVATVERIDPDQRVRVLLEFMGQNTAAEVRAQDLRLV